MLLVGGAVVQQVGWWSLYGDLGLWCGLLGGAAVLAGGLGFDCCVAGHSQAWNWKRRSYTAEERREENERRRAAALGLPAALRWDWGWQLPEDAKKGGWWALFWVFLVLYAFFAFVATQISAHYCPALGTDESWGERFDLNDCLPTTVFAVCSAAVLALYRSVMSVRTPTTPPSCVRCSISRMTRPSAKC